MELNLYVKDAGYLAALEHTLDYFYPISSGSECLRLQKELHLLSVVKIKSAGD